jgi:hypothetical protein
MMLSTLFPPDPTLTVDNVSRVMEKVKPKERQPLLKEVMGGRLQLLIFMSTVIHGLHGKILPGHYTIITRWLQLRK